MKGSRNRFMRGTAMLLTWSMLFSSADVPAFAAEQAAGDGGEVIAEEALTDAVPDGTASAEEVSAELEELVLREQLKASADGMEHPGGVFGFAETMLTMQEGEDGIIRVVRAGGTGGEASVVFKAVDVSAEYGKDYTLRISGSAGEDKTLASNPDMKPLLQEYGEVATAVQADTDTAEAATAPGADAVPEEAAVSAETAAVEETLDGSPLSADGTAVGTAVSDESSVEEGGSAAEPAEAVKAAAGFKGNSLANAVRTQTGEELTGYDWKEYSGGEVTGETKAAAQAGLDATREDLASLEGVTATLHFADGEYMKEIRVQARDDVTSESEEQILIVLQDAVGAELGPHYNGYVNILDNDGEETVRYSVKEKNLIITGGESTAQVVIERTGGIGRMDIVRVGTKAATAVADEDYESLLTEVLFAPGVTEKTVEVNLLPAQRTEAKSFWVGVKSDNGAIIEDNACLVTLLPVQADQVAAVTAFAPGGDGMLPDSADGEEAGAVLDEENPYQDRYKDAPAIGMEYPVDTTWHGDSGAHIIAKNVDLSATDALIVEYRVGGYSDPALRKDRKKKRVTVTIRGLKTIPAIAPKDPQHPVTDVSDLKVQTILAYGKHDYDLYKKDDYIEIERGDADWSDWKSVDVTIQVVGTDDKYQSNKDVWVELHKVRLGYQEAGYTIVINNKNSDYNYYRELRYTDSEKSKEMNPVKYPSMYLGKDGENWIEKKKYKPGQTVSILSVTDNSDIGTNSLGIAADEDTVEFKGFKLQKVGSVTNELSTDYLPLNFRLDSTFYNKYRKDYMYDNGIFALVPVWEPKAAYVSFINDAATVDGEKNRKGGYEDYAMGVEGLTKLDTITVRAYAEDTWSVNDIALLQDLRTVTVTKETGDTPGPKLTPALEGDLIRLRTNIDEKGTQNRTSFTTHLGDRDISRYCFSIDYDRAQIKVMPDPAFADTEAIKQGVILYSERKGEDTQIVTGDWKTPMTIRDITLNTNYIFGAVTDREDGSGTVVKSKYRAFWRDGTLDDNEDGVIVDVDPNYRTFSPVSAAALSYFVSRPLSRLYYSFVERTTSGKPEPVMGFIRLRDKLLISGRERVTGLNGASVTADGHDTFTAHGGFEGTVGDGYYEITSEDFSTLTGNLVSINYSGDAGEIGANYAVYPGILGVYDIDAGQELTISNVTLSQKDAQSGSYETARADAIDPVNGYFTGWTAGDNDYRIGMEARAEGRKIAKGELQFYDKNGTRLSSVVSGKEVDGYAGYFNFDFNPKSLDLPVGTTIRVQFTDHLGHRYYQREVGIFLMKSIGYVDVVNTFTVGEGGLAIDIIGAIDALMDMGWQCDFDSGARGEASIQDEGDSKFIVVGFSTSVLKGQSSNRDNTEFVTAAKEMWAADQEVKELTEQAEQIKKDKGEDSEEYKKIADIDLKNAEDNRDAANTKFNDIAQGKKDENRNPKIGGKLDMSLGFSFLMKFTKERNAEGELTGEYYFENMILTASVSCDVKVDVQFATPIGVTIGIGLALGGTGSASFIVENRTDNDTRYYITPSDDDVTQINVWDSDPSDYFRQFNTYGIFELKPYITLSLSAGVLGDAVKVTVSGKAEFDLLFYTTGRCKGDVTLSANIDVKVTVFHFKKEIAKKTWNMWDGNVKLDNAVMDTLEGDSYLYAPGSAMEAEDVSYMGEGTGWMGATIPYRAIDDEGDAYVEGPLADRIGENPDFHMIALGAGKFAAVFLNVPADRVGDAKNSRAAYYALFNGTSWGEPVILEDDKTLDYYPRIYSLGTHGGIAIWSTVDQDSAGADSDHIDMMNGMNLHGRFLDQEGNLADEVMEITKNAVDKQAVSGDGLLDDYSIYDYSDVYSDAAADVAAGDSGFVVYYAKKMYSRSQKSDYLLGDVVYPELTMMVARYYDYATGWADGGETAETLGLDGLSEEQQEERVAAFNECLYGQQFDCLPGVMLEEELDGDGYLREGTATTAIPVDNTTPILLDSDAASYRNRGLFAYTMDIDGDLKNTTADREVYLQIWDFASKKFGAPIVLTGTGTTDSDVHFASSGNGLWLTWLQDGDIVSMDVAYLLDNEDSLLIRKENYSYINKARPAEGAIGWPRSEIMVHGTKGTQGESDNVRTVSAISDFDVIASDQFIYFLWTENNAGLREGVAPGSEEADRPENQVTEQQMYCLRASIVEQAETEMTQGDQENPPALSTLYDLTNTEPVQITSNPGIHYQDIAFALMDDGRFLGLAWKAGTRLVTYEEAQRLAAAEGTTLSEEDFLPYSVIDTEHAEPVFFMVVTKSILKIKNAAFGNADVVNGAHFTFEVLNDGFDTADNRYTVRAVDADGKSVLLGSETHTVVESESLEGMIGGERRAFAGLMQLPEDAREAEVTITLSREDSVIRTEKLTINLQQDVAVHELTVENTGARGEYLVKGILKNEGGARSEAGEASIGIRINGEDRELATAAYGAMLPGDELPFTATVTARDADFVVTKDTYGNVTETLTVFVKTPEEETTETAVRTAMAGEVRTIDAIRGIDLRLPGAIGETVALAPGVRSGLAYEENLYKDAKGNIVKGMVTGGEALQYLYACDSDCLRIDGDGTVTAVKAGSGTIRVIAYYADREHLTSNTYGEDSRAIGETIAVDGYPNLASAAIYTEEIPFTVEETRGRIFSDGNGIQYQLIRPDGTEVRVIGLDADFVKNAKKHLTAVTIPATVKDGGTEYTVSAIGDSAFANNTAITTVTLGKNVVTIGAKAFSGCTALTGVKMKEGVKEIGTGAFEGCKALTTASLPKNLVTIGRGAWDGCGKLKSVTIPANVQTIGAWAFGDCAGLKKVTIKSAVLASVGKDAFTGTNGALAYALSVKSDEAKQALRGLLIASGECFIDKKGVSYAVLSSEEAAVTATGLDPDFVKNAKRPVTSVSIPATVKYRGITWQVTAVAPESFKGNAGIKTITLGKNLSVIGDSAFEGLNLVSRVTISAGVTEIGACAFKDCAALKTITVSTPVLKTVGSGAFTGINNGAKFKFNMKKKKKVISDILKLFTAETGVTEEMIK